MKKFLRKIALILMVLIATMFTFVGCKDYNCYYHYYVDGGNGSIAIESSDSFGAVIHSCNEENSVCKKDCPKNSYYICMKGNKDGKHEVTFYAIPNPGYKVKEWTLNGKKVKGNKTDSYTAIATKSTGYDLVVCVIFEEI